MKILTKSIQDNLPALYSQEEKSADQVRIRVKFFNAFGLGTWYATEYDPEQKLFFGFAELDPGFGELGYFSLRELESHKSIERDMYFGTHYLKEVVDGARP